jgi:hypothetical protein
VATMAPAPMRSRLAVFLSVCGSCQRLDPPRPATGVPSPRWAPAAGATALRALSALQQRLSPDVGQ